MTIHPIARPLAALLALALSLSVSLAACKGKQAETQATPPVGAIGPFRVTKVAIGSAIDSNKVVAAPKLVFAPEDTIYAVVSTEGAAPTVVISARWTFEDGQVVNESTQTIAPSGPAATEFHIAKSDGWPEGKYKVEISANGAAAQVKEFEVR